MIHTSIAPSDIMYIARKEPALDFMRMMRCSIEKEKNRAIGVLERQPASDVMEKTTSPVNNIITRTIKTAKDGSDRYTIVDNQAKKIRTTILSGSNGSKKIYKQTLEENCKVGKFVKESIFNGTTKVSEKTYYPNGKAATYRQYFSERVNGKWVPELDVKYTPEGHIASYSRNKMRSDGVVVKFQDVKYEKIPNTNLMQEISANFDFYSNEIKSYSVKTFEPGKDAENPLKGITMKYYAEIDDKTGKKFLEKEYLEGQSSSQMRVLEKKYNPEGAVTNQNAYIEEVSLPNISFTVM